MQTVDECQMRLQRRWDTGMRERESLLAALARGLAWLSPARQLQRLDERFEDLGLRLHRALDGKISRDAMAVKGCTDRLVRAFGPEAVARHELRVSALEDRLHWAGEKVLHGRQVVFERLSAQLSMLDPMRPLERGYSLVRRDDGTILRSVREAGIGSRLHVTVRDGVVQTEVTGVVPDVSGD
jgi:exodeoxyribonuclease VII large subunit